MADNQDQLALSWVKDEVHKTLDQARQSLEAFAENQEDKTKIRFCVSCLHQVSGILQMLEFYGAALMAEEMEQLAEMVASDQIKAKKRSFEVLMTAILQLPLYLERVQAGHGDLPMLILPTLNELRAARGEKLLSESAIFSPEIDIERPDRPILDQTANLSPEQIKIAAAKLRPHFQKGLLGILRGQNIVESFKRIYKVVERLDTLPLSDSNNRLWWLTSAFLIVVKDDKLFKSASVHALLGHIDKQLKDLGDVGEVDEHPELKELIKNLLYYIGKSKSTHTKVNSIKQAFELDKLIPSEEDLASEKDKMSGPDTAAISTVVDAIKEDIAGIKDSLDLFVRSKQKGVDDLLPVADHLQRVADTLAMLGLGHPRKVIHEQFQKLKEITQTQETVDDSIVMDIAGALLFVEANISTLSTSNISDELSEEESRNITAQHEIAEAQRKLLSECRVNLMKAKDAIIDFMASNWNHELLENVPSQLTEISGVMLVIGLENTSDMVSKCEVYVSQHVLAGKQIPNEESLEALADVLTTIEYYIESVEQKSPLESIIVAAQDSLKILAAQEQSRASEIIEEIEPQPTISKPVQVHDDDDLIDDEVLEIFLEEAEEELENITELLPVWIANTEDKDSLTTIRRSFHTLKGSGRLVGAELIGEMSWSIETLLNRIIDNTLTPSTEIFKTLSAARDILPSLIKAFSDKTSPDVSPNSVIERAERIARGEYTETIGSIDPDESHAAKLEQDLLTPDMHSIDTEIESDQEQLKVDSENNSTEDDIEIEDLDDDISLEELERTAQAEIEAMRAEQEQNINQVGTTESPISTGVTDDLDEIDPVLLEIFANETESHIEAINQFIKEAFAQPTPLVPSETLVRTLHTLKGSANMAEVLSIAELTTPIEKYFKELKTRQLPVNRESMDLLEGFSSYLESHLNDLIEAKPYDREAHKIYLMKINALWSDLLGHGYDEHLRKERAAQQRDPVVLTKFLAEGADILAECDELIINWQNDILNANYPSTIATSMHAMKSGAEVVNEPELVELAHVSELLFSYPIPTDESRALEMLEVALHVQEGLIDMLDKIAADQQLFSQHELIDAVNAFINHSEDDLLIPELDDDDVALIEAFEEHADVEGELALPKDDFEDREGKALDVELHQTDLNSAEEQPDEISNDDEQENLEAEALLESETLLEAEAELEAEELLEHSEQLVAIEDAEAEQIIEHLALSEEDNLDKLRTESIDINSDLELIEETASDDSVAESLLDSEPMSLHTEELEAEEAIETTAAEQKISDLEDYDEELIEIFLEEADEICETIDLTFAAWQANLANKDKVSELQRALHTIKGSSRMTNIFSVGDFAHGLEDMYEAIVEGRLAPTNEVYSLSVRSHDILVNMLNECKQDILPSLNEAALQEIRDTISGIAKSEAIAPVEQEQEQLEESEDSLLEDSEETLLVEPEDTVLEDSEEIQREEPENTLLDDSEEILLVEPEDNLLVDSEDLLLVEPEDNLLVDSEDLLLEEPENNLLEDSEDLLLEEPENNLLEASEEILLEEPEDTLLDDSEEILLEVPEDNLLDDSEETLLEEPENTLLDDSEEILLIEPEDNLLVESEDSLLEDSEDVLLEEPENNLLEASEEILLEEPEESLLDDSEEILLEDSEEAQLEEPEDILLEDPEETLLEESEEILLEEPEESLLDDSEETLLEDSEEAQLEEPEDILLEDPEETLLEESEEILLEEPEESLLEESEEILLEEPEESLLDDSEEILLEDSEEAQLEESEEILLEEPEDTLLEESEEADIEESSELEFSTNDDLDLGLDDDLELDSEDLAALDTQMADIELQVEQTEEESLNDSIASEIYSDDNEDDEQLDSIQDSKKTHQSHINSEETKLRWEQAAEEYTKLGLLMYPDQQPVQLDEDGEEILEIYLEEAHEIIEEIDALLNIWRDDPHDSKTINNMQRYLHTLKGGARLSELSILGNLTHELETLLVAVEEGRHKSSPELIDLCFEARDCIGDLVEDIESNRHQTTPQSFIAKLHREITGEDSVALEGFQSDSSRYDQEDEQAPEPVATIEQVDEITPEVKDNVVEFEATSEDGIFKINADLPATGFTDKIIDMRKGDRKGAQGETIRVGADALESLVNLAGETSIFRSRLEQQVGQVRNNMTEMEDTIARLLLQLRNLEFETEAQVAYRREVSGHEYAEFDPLEMDRYTRQSELTRSLSESAADLLNIKETINTLTTDAETLLIQQGRTNTELQERLMRTRMVPFDSLVPRLQRIVRQVSREVNKNVELNISAEGEMDRSVLERLIAPLEHMLRNAIDHGIETIEERKAANKNEVGHITIVLERDGPEVVIIVKDDGRGINVEAVREKAIERNLISENAHLSSLELQQMIFEPGFSTADKVTQISGRGVGMDVVASEIKQLNGVVFTESEFGEGTNFTVRLPFTVSMNKALMVQVQDDVFAIPLSAIEGIVRVTPYELQSYYENPEDLYHYAGEDYSVRYLNKMLDHNVNANLDGLTRPLPVLLLHGLDHPIAMHVDALLGSREIVVKSVGAQLSTINGVSGATILGDGRVVLILDMPTLLRRSETLIGINTDEFIEEEEEKIPTIMVVDDSITVRKVTQRLLKRNGFEVITAKDGVDALTVLHDHKPDCMLLDIEMPRMDGFELATIIRHEDRLKDLPIIMITSRTGDKHRTRATEIGVEKYMGKPFNDVELLENISLLLKK